MLNVQETADPGHILLQEEIRSLKRDMNAVILAHYYQRPEIQDVADMIGDSFALAQYANAAQEQVIVLCGVSFMAETAKIVNPAKTVLLPDAHAGCPLADSAPYEEFLDFRRQHPGHLAITYINSSTEVKAISDIICTSSSVQRIVESIPRHIPLMFAPDKNLGTYIERKLGREMLLWPGGCVVHLRFDPAFILHVKKEHPDAVIAAHPECESDVLALADFIGSTSSILDFAVNCPATTIIVATEPGIIHQMQKANPGKNYIAAPAERLHSGSICANMKKNTLEKLLACMKNQSPEIEIEEPLRRAAAIPIQRMLELGASQPSESRHIIEEIQLPFRQESLN